MTATRLTSFGFPSTRQLIQAVAALLGVDTWTTSLASTGPDTQCFGDETWDFGWNSGRDYGSAIPQAYFELAINDLTIKGGHFYTIIGWEVVQAPDNFFYTHAYTMYYGEPFTHTGLLASYKLNDKVTVHGGWTDGWDDGWTNPNGASTFLGGVNLSLTDKASLNWACSTGTLGDGRGVNRGDVYMNSLVFQYKMTERFTYILQHDLGKHLWVWTPRRPNGTASTNTSSTSSTIVGPLECELNGSATTMEPACPSMPPVTATQVTTTKSPGV